MVAVVNDLAGVAAATGRAARRRRRAAGTVRREQHELRWADGARGVDGPFGARRVASNHRLPVIYSVDSVAGALGESLFGTAKNLNNFFYMHFGVGLGGTLVANRSAYKGANSNATEIGHVPIVPDGKECYCGNRGLPRALPVAAFACRGARTGGREGWRARVAGRDARGARADVDGVVSRSRCPPAQCGVHDREPARSRDDRDRRLGAQGAGRAHRCAR